MTGLKPFRPLMAGRTKGGQKPSPLTFRPFGAFVLLSHYPPHTPLVMYIKASLSTYLQRESHTRGCEGGSGTKGIKDKRGSAWRLHRALDASVGTVAGGARSHHCRPRRPERSHAADVGLGARCRRSGTSTRWTTTPATAATASMCSCYGGAGTVGNQSWTDATRATMNTNGEVHR